MILDLLKRITSSLEEKHIPYMLSGGLALNAYSIPRMSLDIDIVIELRVDMLKDFFEIFKDNYYINEETTKFETKKHGMFNVIDHQTGFKIDFIVRKNTAYRILEFSRRKKELIGDIEVWIVSPEDLIISKLEWIQKLQSDKQVSDIENLLAIPKLDKNYIKKWCNDLNINTFNFI